MSSVTWVSKQTVIPKHWADGVDLAAYSRADKAAAVLVTPLAGEKVFIESSDGGWFIAKTGSPPGTYSDDGGSYCGTVFIPTGGDGSCAWTRDYNGDINAEWFGVVGNGVINDTASADLAYIAAGSGNVMLPYSADGYVIDDTVSIGNATTLLAGENQLAGTADEADINAVTLTNGSWDGVPFSPDMRGKRIEIVSGTIRQNVADRTKWDVLSDSAHSPLGLTITQATAVGATITVDFTKTYSSVISFIATPDENLANAHNITVGANAGLSSVGIQCGASISGEALIRWDGTGWVDAVGTGQELNFAPSFENDAYGHDSVRIPHDYCPGIGVDIAMWMNAGAVNYIPQIFTISNTDMVLKFIDPTTGLVVNNGSENIKMAFKLSKRYNEGLLLDGTSDSDGLSLESGNIWFFGIFEV